MKKWQKSLGLLLGGCVLTGGLWRMGIPIRFGALCVLALLALTQ
jgi:hypothetical protein